MEVLTVKTDKKQTLYNITDDINKLISDNNIESGICVIFAAHTTAGITICENADPDVLTDMYMTYDISFPNRNEYSHAEGNSDGHFKSIITGCEQTCIIENGKLALGIWQAVYFCEFDGPRTRKVYVKFIKD